MGGLSRPGPLKASGRYLANHIWVDQPCWRVYPTLPVQPKQTRTGLEITHCHTWGNLPSAGGPDDITITKGNNTLHEENTASLR
jgi:hypothetical protein